MRRSAGLFAGFLIGISVAHSHAAALSTTEIRAKIARDGATGAVSALMAGSGAGWKVLLARIGGGDDAWLDIARAIRPGVDAGSGEDLTFALASALSRNPAGVLRMAGRDFPLAKICDVPLIEPTDAQVAVWKTQALTALARVHSDALRAKVNECRADLNAVK
jgi:hypothetical protein